MYVIMLHSVGNHQSEWYRHWLSVSLEHFETLCLYLSENKYTTHFLDEWYDYFSLPRKKDPKKIILTFDDGYLDNWVFVLPMLKKYGLKGTVFINPEFVEPSEAVRPNLEDAWTGKADLKEMQTLGFLNWPEILAMQQSGVMDIQSHSMSHNFYFLSNTIIDIYGGQQKYDWIPWFTNPELKPFYITKDQSLLVSHGYPVFEYGRALSLRRYFPDDRLITRSIELFGNGRQDKGKLFSELTDLLVNFPGRFEDDIEMEKRYRYELFDSKRLLEEKLNKKVDFLCWPGGGFNDLSVQLSVEAGYKASTKGSALSETKVDNLAKYKRISRFGLSSFYSSKQNNFCISDKSHLIKMVKSRTGNNFLRVFLKLKKEYVKSALLK